MDSPFKPIAIKGNSAKKEPVSKSLQALWVLDCLSGKGLGPPGFSYVRIINAVQSGKARVPLSETSAAVRMNRSPASVFFHPVRIINRRKVLEGRMSVLLDYGFLHVLSAGCENTDYPG